MPSYTKGVFTPSAFGTQIIKEQEMMGAGSRMNELKKPIVAGQAILMQQDPRITEMWAGERCIGAKVVTLRACDTTIDSGYDPTCTVPEGNQAGSEALTLEKERITNPAIFTIWDDQCHNAFTFQDELAYHKLKAKIDLEVELTKVLLAAVVANADTPTADWFETTGSVVGTTYEVAAVNFKSDLIADLLAAAQITDMYDSIILNGRNFFNDSILAQYQGIACCDNDTILNGNQYFQLFWDLRNVDAVASRATFVLDKNAFIFWSSPLYNNTAPAELTEDTWVWVETLPRFQYMANGTMNPVYVDVRAKRVCSVSGAFERYGWRYELRLHGNLKPNLVNCDGRQGILHITQDMGS